MDGIQSEIEEEMPYRRAPLAQRRWVRPHIVFRYASSLILLFMKDFLQERLNIETSEPGFSDLPFRFVEVSKLLLDVCVIQVPFGSTQYPCNNALEPQMTSKIRISYVCY